MKNFIKFRVIYGLLTVFLAGCYGIPPEDNYVGMTKKEAAAHLAGFASRSRWSQNRFVIEIQQEHRAVPHWFRNLDDVVKNPSVMSADQWRCEFFPQRHWLLGWNSLAAAWHYKTLFFQDNKVVRQENGTLPYKTYGVGGETPFPQFPWNFHRVNGDIYRSGQPDEDEFSSLHTFNGIRSVLNLRKSSLSRKYISSVNRKFKNAITLYELPVATDAITEEDLGKILKVVRDAPKPVLIHCLLGSNRTGCVVAACRIVFENWRVEDAVSELMKPEYGHHKILYSNIPDLLRKADWQKIRNAVLK